MFYLLLGTKNEETNVGTPQESDESLLKITNENEICEKTLQEAQFQEKIQGDQEPLNDVNAPELKVKEIETLKVKHHLR